MSFQAAERDLPDAARLARLIEAGGRCVEAVFRVEGSVPFTEWSRALREEVARTGGAVQEDYLLWVWECLREEAHLAANRPLFLGGPAERTGRKRLVDVLPAGSTFRMHLSGSREPEGQLDTLPRVTVLDILRMTPGKGGRLECAPVAAELEVCPPDRHLLVAEADLFMVDVDQIREEGASLIVSVGSLNQAYTRASLRLERHRATHGGSIYASLNWLHDRAELSLEQIRTAVERGEWRTPVRPDSLFPVRARVAPDRPRRQRAEASLHLPGLA